MLCTIFVGCDAYEVLTPFQKRETYANTLPAKVHQSFRTRAHETTNHDCFNTLTHIPSTTSIRKHTLEIYRAFVAVPSAEL